jgi:type I restriction enzyme, S subunit
MGPEWPLIPLGEVTENFDALRVPVKEATRRPGPYPYYGASGIVDYVDKYIFDGLHLLVAEDGENLRTRKLPIAFLAEGKFWVNNHAHIIRGNDKTDTRFLMYALSVADLGSYLTGSTMPKLTQGNLNRIPIPCPPVEEQRDIAEILGALDEKIDLNRRMTEALEAMASAIYRDWFVDFGPTRAKAEGRPSYLAEDIWCMFPDELDDEDKPIGWPLKRWKELASLEYGKRLEGYKTNDGLIPVYGTNGPIGWHDTALCSEPGVIIGRKGAYRGVHFSDGPFYAIDTAFFMKFKKTISSRWAYYTVAGYDIDSMDSGSAIPSTSRGDFGSILVVEPPYLVQSKFDELLAPLWAKERANISENDTLVQFRDFLLPKFMSGEIRVKEAEKIMAEVA